MIFATTLLFLLITNGAVRSAHIIEDEKMTIKSYLATTFYFWIGVIITIVGVAFGVASVIWLNFMSKDKIKQIELEEK